MTSSKDYADDSHLFNTTQPFQDDEQRHHEDGAPVQQWPTAEAAGVRSNNPFEGGEGERHEQADPDESLPPTSAVSPGAGGTDFPFADEGNQIDRTISAQTDTTSGSPGAAVEHNATPFDSAESPKEIGPRETNEALNSNVAGDRAERGTALFQNADPHPQEDEDEKSRQSRSDSSSAGKDDKPRVGFAGTDTIDKAEADHDSSPDGMLDKIKSAGHNMKERFSVSDVKSTGPFKRLNPTKATMRVQWGDDGDPQRNPSGDVGILWRSRDNRKGRNSVVIPRASMAYPNLPTKNRPIYTSSFKGVSRNLYRMAFTFPYWDMAFWSGWSYTWGSVLFVMDGTWAWIPYGWPKEKLTGIEDYGVGIVFFIGALLYQLGATMAYLEAVNDGSFHGSAMRRFLEGHQDEQKQMLDEKIHHFFGHFNPHTSKKEHEDEEAEKRAYEVDPEYGWKTIHRPERRGSIYPPGKRPAPRRGGVDLGEAEEGESHEYLTWRWWPTYEALKNHHVYEIGYIACSIQLFGATLYSWCGLMALPGIYDSLDTDAKLYGAYWFPEICGSCCFLTASALFLLETQEKWYKPMPHVMGWWIGVWAMVGSWGFLFCGIFGAFATATDSHWGDYQSELSSTWGSFGYLLSSLCQWYEAVNKHPVEEMLNEPGEMKSFQVHLP